MSTVRFAVDPATQKGVCVSAKPAGWRQRWLFASDDGASNWLAVGEAQDFRRPVGRLEAALFAPLRQRSRLLAQVVLRVAEAAPSPRTLVSLGPGDAQLDHDLVETLAASDPSLSYIPVDISRRLLEHAVAKLEPIAAVPVAVLADFEARFPFIEDAVKVDGDGPRLFALLGNTFGNLDHRERPFVERASGGLSESDRLMLSVSTKGPEWAAAADPLLAESGYPEPVKRFICAGRADGISFAQGGSDVPATSTVEVADSDTGEPLISIRRYDWEALLGWLHDEMRLDIVAQEEVAFDRIEGAGVVVVRRR